MILSEEGTRVLYINRAKEKKFFKSVSEINHSTEKPDILSRLKYSKDLIEQLVFIEKEQ